MTYGITLFGNKTTTGDLLRHLTDAGHAIGLVVTLSREVEASKDISGADDIEGVARSLSIPVYVTRDYRLRSPQDREFFATHTFDIGLCTGWQRLLPPHVLAAFPSGIFGFHGSCWRFPDGRGRSPLNWSMRRGGDRIHHNCFRYVAAADAGEVFHTTEFPITPFDSISTVQFKALLDMKRVSERLLTAHRHGAVRTVPQHGAATIVLPKLGPGDGRIRFADLTRAEVLALINATSRPFPGAFAVTADGATLRIWRAIPCEFPWGPEDLAATPGRVLDASIGQVLIACTDGPILVVDHDFEAGSDRGALRSGVQFV